MKEALGNNGPERIKRVPIPPKEEVIKKLKDVGLVGAHPQSDIFLIKFVEFIGGDNHLPGGFNLFWELSVCEPTLDIRDPVLNRTYLESFDPVIDAIVPDPEIAARAKEYRRIVLETAEKERARAKKEVTGVLDRLTYPNQLTSLN